MTTDPGKPSEASAALKFKGTDAVDTLTPKSGILKTLLAYWQSKRGPAGRLPSRADIDPLELRNLLPYVYLIDVITPTRFRIRLLGEEHVAIYGPGVVGRVIDDIFPPEAANEFNRLYAAVVRRREPVLNRGQITWLRNREWMRYEGLHAPLASDGTAIDCIFGAGAFDHWDEPA